MWAPAGLALSSGPSRMRRSCASAWSGENTVTINTNSTIIIIIIIDIISSKVMVIIIVIVIVTWLGESNVDRRRRPDPRSTLDEDPTLGQPFLLLFVLIIVY